MEKQPNFNPADLPQDVMKKKEVFQHPQPADAGNPLQRTDDKSDSLKGKENEKSSKEEGLNEARSHGDAGAFEGFEDQSES